MDSSNEKEEQFFIPGFKDAANYTQETLRSVLTTTKASNDLPSAGDSYDYYSTFPAFRSVLFRKGQSILSLMTSLIQNQGVRKKFQGRELEDKYDLLVDVNDAILENISNYLDEASGLKKSDEELVIAVKPPSSINTSWNKKQFNTNSPQSFKLLTAKNISRPQLTFKDKIDNSNSIFVPIIKDKPNSIKPLAVMLEKGEEKNEYCHPYELEIEKFKPDEQHLQEVETTVFPKPLEETPLILVNDEEQLKKMCDELKKEKEIAVDLEHHSYRSFQGFTCLMQISTREKDYIVDVLKLRSEMQILNDVFTDPKIVKVLHGADMDVLWLQRDLGLYIVNLFDTGQAGRVLHFAHLSLSYLLKHYCKLEVDKKFQLADWRIRPLPSEMIKYAREDTHYLLYVYDCLKNDLIKQGNEMKNLLHSTFERSKLICLKKYEKPLFSEDKYLDLYKKSKKILNVKQLYCLRELYSWRDKVARENDESLLYVLPNHMLLQIAEALPKEQQGILACCNPIPPLVKQQLNELHSLILKTNDSSLKQLETLELEQRAQAPKINNQIDLSSLIHCPHDILHLEDRKVQAGESSSSATSLPHIAKTHPTSSILNQKPILSALFYNNHNHRKVEKGIPKQAIPEKVIDQIRKLISPFDRFKLTEELQSSQVESKKKSVTNENDEHKKKVEDLPADDSCAVIESDLNESVVEVANIVPEVAAADTTTCEVIESTPIRKKKNKRKKRKSPPDISIIESPEPPSKKSRSPEIVTLDDDSFTPYDYSQSDCSQFSQSKKKNSFSKQNKTKVYQTPRPYFGKNRKHAKQATYSAHSKNDGGCSSKWPKNK